VPIRYQGQELSAICKGYGIKLEIVKRPSGRRCIYNEQWKAEWIPVERSFSILPRRWVVERTYAWMGRNRCLSKDYEFLPTTSESYLYLAMTHVLMRRLKKLIEKHPLRYLTKINRNIKRKKTFQ